MADPKRRPLVYTFVKKCLTNLEHFIIIENSILGYYSLHIYQIFRFRMAIIKVLPVELFTAE
jgi:hypothetical protein